MCTCNHANNFCLLGHTLKYTSHLLVALNEAKFSIFQSLFSCKLLDEFARFLEIVARQAREEVMRHLQVQPAVQKRE